MTDLSTIGGSIIAALLSVALFLPKLLNMYKGEGITGSVLDRIKAVEDNAKVQERRAQINEEKLYHYSTKITRLMLLMISIESLLAEYKVNIPQDIIDEMFALKKEIDELFAVKPETKE